MVGSACGLQIKVQDKWHNSPGPPIFQYTMLYFNVHYLAIRYI